MSAGDLARATADAAAAAMGDAPDEATAEEAEGTEGTSPTPETSPGAQPDVGQGTGGDEPSEAGESEPGTDDVPTSYFGLDLSELDAEQRAAVIGELKKRDDHIGKLLRERTPEEEGEEGEGPAEPAPEEVTDEAILQALGLDPEDPFDEKAAKVAVPLVRKQLAQDRAIAQLVEIQELNDLDRTWRSALSGLEREYGALPPEMTHDAVMEYAAKNGITDPTDAFWRIVGPGRAVLTSALTKNREAQLLAAKKAAASVRPDSSVAEEDAPLESKSVKDATKEAASKVLAQLGIV